MKEFKIAVLPGDGIGPEVMEQAVKILKVIERQENVKFQFEYGLLGGCAIDADGTPLPEQTVEITKNADAVMLGAVGGPKWDQNPNHLRPEAGLLALRKELDLYANLRPAQMYECMAKASSIKEELVAGVDIMVVRELTGGIYFGEKQRYKDESGKEVAVDTLVYHEDEIERIVRKAFEIAGKRDRRLVSVDKANVLESSRLWRSVVERVALEYPNIECTHMLVDACAMQLVRAPKQFDVIVTENMFGDILSDEAAMLTGSIGMLASASISDGNFGLYEPVHGSAPDIVGQELANPIATILSTALMLRYSFGLDEAAKRIEEAVEDVLNKGIRTADIATTGEISVGTNDMANFIAEVLETLD